MWTVALFGRLDPLIFFTQSFKSQLSVPLLILQLQVLT
jgi:hypothetical protein